MASTTATACVQPRAASVARTRRRRRPRPATRRRVTADANASETSSASSSSSASAFPVFRKMEGRWEDAVRYVHATMETTPKIRLTGTREIRVADDGTVSLRSKTTFPGGKVLELAFAGERVDEAFGLKNVVKFVRTPLEREAEPVEGYYPIVLLASEHPAEEDHGSFDVVVVREVLAETGRTLLSECITLIDKEGGGTEASHVAQEVNEDGSLGGVQLWRSVLRAPEVETLSPARPRTVSSAADAMEEEDAAARRARLKAMRADADAAAASTSGAGDPSIAARKSSLPGPSLDDVPWGGGPTTTHPPRQLKSAPGPPYPPPPAAAAAFGGFANARPPPPPPPPTTTGGAHFAGWGGGGRGGGRRGAKAPRLDDGGRGGRGGDGDAHAYYKKSMVEDPWRHLEGRVAAAPPPPPPPQQQRQRRHPAPPPPPPPPARLIAGNKHRLFESLDLED
ncbi:uncharacterized protein MICPUCDRAFT_43393 [Micromonas pusilla CCMP1545]|uniref:Predicted protein n=1 Tax=Micromonas pusilla (strain CCMP1545) TaxID=564608 RepID=C1N8Q1_MICPC|nr:uncharacterized protein MICPUCDRAFT_43393 [Micromonas pusilla CCMP1545]EEH51219.1 predicted protein [Micromonas pusilla CCMP1545]|eukprot:XP_003064314.1 predicted protein [Micromonas pusilla CCMP1545]